MENKIFIEVEESYENDPELIAPKYETALRVFMLSSIDTEGTDHNTGAFYTARFNMLQYSMLEEAKCKGVNTLFKVEEGMTYLPSYKLLEILNEVETDHNLNKVGRLSFYIGNDCRIYYRIDYNEYEEEEEYKLYKPIYTDEGYEYLSNLPVEPDFMYATCAHTFEKKLGASFKRFNKYSEHYDDINYKKLSKQYIEELTSRIKTYNSETVPLERKMWTYLNSITIGFFTLHRVWDTLRIILLENDTSRVDVKMKISLVESVWVAFTNRMFDENKAVPESLSQLYNSMKEISDEETQKIVDEFKHTFEDRVKPCAYTKVVKVN